MVDVLWDRLQPPRLCLAKAVLQGLVRAIERSVLQPKRLHLLLQHRHLHGRGTTISIQQSHTPFCTGGRRRPHRTAGRWSSAVGAQARSMVSGPVLAGVPPSPLFQKKEKKKVQPR